MAVLDEAGADRVTVLAASDTGLVALALAARRPDRVAHLVLVHAYARYVRAGDYPYGVDRATAITITEEARATDGGAADRFDPLSHIAPSVARDPDLRRWWDGAGRRAASPATAAALQAAVLARRRARRAAAGLGAGHLGPPAGVHELRRRPRPLPRRPPGPRPARHGAGADELWFTGDVEPIVSRVEAALGDI